MANFQNNRAQMTQTTVVSHTTAVVCAVTTTAGSNGEFRLEGFTDILT